MSQIRTWKQILLLCIAILLWAFSAPSAFAQSLPCGNIIGPYNFFNDGPNGNLVTEDIEDCDDPFSLTVDPASPYSLVIDGQGVEDGGTIAIPEGRTKDIVVNGDSNLDGTAPFLFRHEGDDFVYQSLEAPEPTQSEYEAYAGTFFPSNQEAQLYLNILEEYLETGDTDRFFYDENGDELIDPNTSETIESRFYSFFYSATDYYQVENIPYIEAGTYTIVMKEFLIILTERSIFDKFMGLFIKTAHAQEGLLSYKYAITFTITELVEEPEGASSVLFLPGIQASRLYEGNNQLWEPNRNADVERLAMTDAGWSVNNIYTEDVIDEIVLPLFGANIYKGFLGMLEELRDEEEIIKDHQAFAYDWRYSVDDVVLNGVQYENEVRSMVAAVEDLADNSYTGKVTVIGHSNGGLVAKVLIDELERQGKVNLVDKVVFIGTPHLGTPKAIGVMLHGHKQQKLFGLAIDDMTVRDVVKNMPGVYGLLPSSRYFDVSGDVLVTSDDTPSTASIREYGDIDSYDELTAFLLDTNNVRDDEAPVHTPGTLNPAILNSYTSLRSRLDNWLAPENVQVYEVVGTGLATVKGFEYKQFPCALVICSFGNYSKAFPLLSNAGDETVMELSADAYDGNKVKGVVNLLAEGEQLSVFTKTHADMTESPTVQEFIESIIRFPYLNETIVVPQNFISVSTYTIIGAHSPVHITLETASGERVGFFDGVLFEEVPGSQYFELGGSSYIVIPKDIEYEVTVQGNEVGLYSLTIDTLSESDIQTNEFTYLGASTSPQTVAVFSASSTGFSTIKTDFDGDGTYDKEQKLNGDIVVGIVYTFDTLISEIKSLRINKIYKSILLIQAELAKYQMEKGKTKLAAVTLYNLEKTVKLYKQKKVINADVYNSLIEIITQIK